MKSEPVANLILSALKDEGQRVWDYTVEDSTEVSPNILTITFRPKSSLAVLGIVDISAVLDCCNQSAVKVRAAWTYSWDEGPRLVINAGIFGRHTHLIFLLTGAEQSRTLIP